MHQAFASMWPWVTVCCTGGGSMNSTSRARHGILDVLNRVLGQQYHVVVGNPPYITVKDQGLNQAYRKRYTTCHRQYSLAVPFTERFFDLAVYGNDPQPAGYVGMITANSFMKREF